MSPLRLMVDGVAYIREDAVPRSASAVEPSYSVRELSERSGFPASTLYDNVRRGDLVAVMPNGTTKGMRILESDWSRFIAAKRSNATQ